MNIETKIESKVPSNWIQCVVGTQPTEIYFRNVRLVEVMYTTSTLEYKNLPHNPFFPYLFAACQVPRWQWKPLVANSTASASLGPWMICKEWLHHHLSGLKEQIQFQLSVKENANCSCSFTAKRLLIQSPQSLCLFDWTGSTSLWASISPFLYTPFTYLIAMKPLFPKIT